jgi:glycosyltransferase involved in cell wall biosynthesis
LQVVRSAPGETGGTEKFVDALTEALHDDVDFSILFPVPSGFGLQTHWNLDTGRAVELQFLLPGGPTQVSKVVDEVAAEALAMALDMFDFDAVHLHNLIGHSLAPLTVLSDFAGRVVCSVHDLYLACPNHSLLYMDHEACGIPEDLSYCARCLAAAASSPRPALPRSARLSLEHLEEFRTTVEMHLGRVDRWVFATQSAADYFLRVYEPDPDRVEIVEHGSVIALDRGEHALDEALIHEEPLRVAFVGLGWPKKGMSIVNDLADAFEGTSIEIHHFGELRQAASAALHAHGPYDNEHLPELLHGAGIHVVLLPGSYAETFGLVMTEALVAGLPVIGARYGALGERIRASGAGWTIDPMDGVGLRALIERLDRARDELERTTRRARAVELHTVGQTADRYLRLYGVETRTVSARC